MNILPSKKQNKVPEWEIFPMISELYKNNPDSAEDDFDVLVVHMLGSAKP